MERVTLNVERLHLGVADLDALFVSARVQRALDFQAGLGCRRRDQLDDSHAIRERPAAPGLRDVAEQAVLDPVPLRCARRIMVDVEHEPGLVGEPLQLDLPQPDACAIRAAAVGCDRQLTRIRIALAPHAVQPLPDRGDSELCRIARDPDADPACIGADVVHAIGRHLAEFLVLEVVHLHASRIALGPIVSTAVAIVADQLFLLRVHRDDGLVRSLRRNHLGIDVFELRVAVGMLRALVRLAVRLPAVAEAPATVCARCWR